MCLSRSIGRTGYGENASHRLRLHGPEVKVLVMQAIAGFFLVKFKTEGGTLPYRDVL
jgi:hypothetical protein